MNGCKNLANRTIGRHAKVRFRQWKQIVAEREIEREREREREREWRPARRKDVHSDPVRGTLEEYLSSDGRRYVSAIALSVRQLDKRLFAVSISHVVRATAPIHYAANNPKPSSGRSLNCAVAGAPSVAKTPYQRRNSQNQGNSSSVF